MGLLVFLYRVKKNLAGWRVEWRVSTFRERRKQDGGCCITLYSPRGRIGESKMAAAAASPRERPVKKKKKPRWQRLQRPVYNT
jgi:hypothetical protein